MKHSKHDTSNDPALDRRQGLDDRELKENAADNQRARARARADWEHAASHRKDAEKGRKPGQAGKGEMPPGVGSRDLHDPGSRDPDAPPTVNRS
ncbi:hypothetical protein [Cupriavidus nantongensis]|uniref:Uncharacterized protein n=1 Tax=Cupriavidus nantongensis TaxID=1796606 RepID=A0A142JG06_9BURK|nr:hypothetical protein [Cupriavidus nantongensis]AMR77018.1 hypothetical protein A2G96_04255 [Cupriavidus nantongensis]